MKQLLQCILKIFVPCCLLLMRLLNELHRDFLFFGGLMWAQYVSIAGDIRRTQFQISNSAGLKWCEVLFSISRRKPDTSGTQASVSTPQAALSSWEFLSRELFCNGTRQRRNVALYNAHWVGVFKVSQNNTSCQWEMIQKCEKMFWEFCFFCCVTPSHLSNLFKPTVEFEMHLAALITVQTMEIL